MNPLALRALEEALTRQRPAPARASKLLPPVLANEPLPELVITGPINEVMQREGKRYALEVVRAYGTNIRRPEARNKAAAELTRYAAAQPSSVAAGIKQVIDVLKGAL